MFLKSHTQRILKLTSQGSRIHVKHRNASVCVTVYITLEQSEHSEYGALAGDICSSIYASEDTERYLLKHMLRKNSPVPDSIAQLSNTLEYGLPSLPRSESKILMSSFDHSVTYTGICQGTSSIHAAQQSCYISQDSFCPCRLSVEMWPSAGITALFTNITEKKLYCNCKLYFFCIYFLQRFLFSLVCRLLSRVLLHPITLAPFSGFRFCHQTDDTASTAILNFTARWKKQPLVGCS